MIKAIASRSDGTKILVIGLSMKNMTLLQSDKPIWFELSELGDPDVSAVAIVGGETEEAIMAEFRKNGVVMDEPGEVMQ